MVSEIEKVKFKAEFEKLKLKQKILLESLNMQTKEDQTLELKSLDQKVEFLIKLFNLIRKEEIDSGEKIFTFKTELSEKIEEISENIETLISNVHRDIEDKIAVKVNEKFEFHKREIEKIIDLKIDKRLNLYFNTSSVSEDKNLSNIKKEIKKEILEFS